MLTYISIIALTGSIGAATIDETEIQSVQSVQSESFLMHIAQADTTTASDDESETDDYIEWTFL